MSSSLALAGVSLGFLLILSPGTAGVVFCADGKTVCGWYVICNSGLYK